jgi:hypothetical protein
MALLTSSSKQGVTGTTGGGTAHDSAVPGKRTLVESVASPSYAASSGEMAGGAAVPEGGITGDSDRGGPTGDGGITGSGTPGGGTTGGGTTGGGTTGGGSTATTTPRLTKSTVSGPSVQNNGGFSWAARWAIQNATTSTNGWIVQHVVVHQNVTDASNNPIVPGTGSYGGLRTSWYPLWEAWQVRGGQVYVGGSSQAHNADTYGQGPVGPSTKGTTEVIGRADFYPNLTLPSGFTVRNAAPAWALPATNSNPGLTGGTGALDHNLTATWNGVAGTGATTVTTV